MAALIPDERYFILASCIFFFLLVRMEQAISGTSAAAYTVMEPHELDKPKRFAGFVLHKSQNISLCEK